ATRRRDPAGPIRRAQSGCLAAPVGAASQWAMFMSDTRPSARARWRSRLIAAHRWLGLIAAAFWLLQAVTGVLIVFHWELDDAMLAGAHPKTDLPAIEARLAALAPSGSDRRVT